MHRCKDLLPTAQRKTTNQMTLLKGKVLKKDGRIQPEALSSQFSQYQNSEDELPPRIQMASFLQLNLELFFKSKDLGYKKQIEILTALWS